LTKNSEILNNPIFNLPIEREKGDFIEFLKLKFDEYFDTLKHFNGELGEAIRSHNEMISCEMACIFSSLHSYYEGKPSYAYLQLTKCLENIRGHLWIQTQEISENRNYLFRIRNGNNNQFKRCDLFHIPFELRNIVRRQRYSIPGLPCIYLSTDIYTCWEEMDRPDIKNVHVSRFDLNESGLKFLFLDQRSEVIRRMFNKPYEECDESSKMHILNFILTYPLLLACSIKVEDYDSEFIPEYLVPQILLQWVIESEDIDGIQYISNKTQFKLKPVVMESETNIVIPTKEFKSKGYCPELLKRIKLTDPISYSLLELSDDSILKHRASFINILMNRKKHKIIELIAGQKTVYENTIFGKLEKKLSTMNVDHIHE